ncbi:Molybdenum cofactor biosynthesis, MoeB [Metarhizium guizhouense ARSEF 977]|uniref:Ubiquitin-like 1-activating enzyme E1A n=1 Tax=Metarhizium guizhouense (strain ARSEF 977) TaxID=1276136 RepID=A0A0B4H264_METGA|nr:Molybdenum cofactor biosynthesis, MoeB [Metarhizium guizhouense ARSEF 977]
MEHQNHAGSGADADAGALQNMEPNGGMPVFDQHLLGQANPEAVAAMMAGQPFIPDPSLGSVPMADGTFMLPMMMPNGLPMQLPTNTVSADDIALYDRQIRLWGIAAQEKIQNAHILLITMRGLAHEIAKNLVLAGVGSITLLDGSSVTEADLGCQFFLSEGGESLVGQNRAEAASHALRKLNPRVQVHVDPESVTAKGPSYFAAYDIVIATDLDPGTFNIINTATRINGRPFYAAGTHGMYGFIFSDLIEHDYIISREAGNVSTTPKQESRTRSITDVKTKRDGGKTIESVSKRELYSTWFLASDVAVLPREYTSSKRRLKSVTPALSCLRALWEFKQLQGNRLPSNREDLKLFTQIATQKHKALSLPSETLRPEFLRSFLQNLGSEIAPVTAILGGQLAQDVINVLGQSQQPIQNMVILDGNTMEAPMYPLHPELELGASLLSVPNADAASAAANPMVPGDMHMFGTGDVAFPGAAAAAAVPMPNVDVAGPVMDGMGAVSAETQPVDAAQAAHTQTLQTQGAPDMEKQTSNEAPKENTSA